MNPFARRHTIEEPPIVLQILVLLLGGLVVAQLVTLLLTLVLPPAPPVQRSLGDVAAALRGEPGRVRLARTVQGAPPKVDGPGWFTSAESRHMLARLLGARDADVRLAFYAPLPFAGITAPPTQPTQPPLPLHQTGWAPAPEVLHGNVARLIPAGLLLIDPTTGGGGAPGAGFSGGGVNGGAMGRGGSPGDGRLGGLRSGQGSGRGGEQGRGMGDVLRRDRGRSTGSASPADLDRQPIAPDRGGEDRGGGNRADPAPSTAQGIGGRGRDRPLPTEGFDPRIFQTAPDGATAPVQTPHAAPVASPSDLDRQPMAPDHRAMAGAAPASAATAPRPPVVIPVPVTTAPQSLSVSTARHGEQPAEARPLPIAPQGRALFGLAPAPFVEGDFVAALQGRDGRWTVVQPFPEAFPNAWQRRVMLWFVIAFAIVAPFGWLFARHIVRPLARFTEAAELLGRDPAAALVALDGPAEIGRAAHAFNVMQNRLRSFVDDRTAMVGAISHDLRTPLTRMRFRIEEVDDDATRAGMTEEVAEMEAMITSVLAFIRDASTPNARERLDLGMLVEDVAQDAAMVGSDVAVERMAAAPVEVDVLGMRRLLANLVENAVKYGERARIRLVIDEDAAVAEIVDDGPGVPEDELERAFEPFYRASNADVSGKTGTGLGLAVCRSIARAHGGDVRLVNAADGFRAQLRLPLAYGAERAVA